MEPLSGEQLKGFINKHKSQIKQPPAKITYKGTSPLSKSVVSQSKHQTPGRETKKEEKEVKKEKEETKKEERKKE